MIGVRLGLPRIRNNEYSILLTNYFMKRDIDSFVLRLRFPLILQTIFLLGDMSRRWDNMVAGLSLRIYQNLQPKIYLGPDQSD